MTNKSLLLTLIFAFNFSFVGTATAETSDYAQESTLCEQALPSNHALPCFHSEPSESYRYGTLGVGPIIFIPNVGLGYRERHYQFGWDTALSFSTVGYGHQVSVHLVGHRYLSPARKNSAYVGLGLMGSAFFANKGKGTFGISPDFVFGKVLNRSCDRHQFIEMHVAVPTVLKYSRHSGTMFFPLMYLKYGISF